MPGWYWLQLRPQPLLQQESLPHLRPDLYMVLTEGVSEKGLLSLGQLWLVLYCEVHFTCNWWIIPGLANEVISTSHLFLGQSFCSLAYSNLVFWAAHAQHFLQKLILSSEIEKRNSCQLKPPVKYSFQHFPIQYGQVMPDRSSICDYQLSVNDSLAQIWTIVRQTIVARLDREGLSIRLGQSLQSCAEVHCQMFWAWVCQVRWESW